MGRTQIDFWQIRNDALTGADLTDTIGVYDETNEYNIPFTSVLWKGKKYYLKPGVNIVADDTREGNLSNAPDVSSDWIMGDNLLWKKYSVTGSNLSVSSGGDHYIKLPFYVINNLNVSASDRYKFLYVFKDNVLLTPLNDFAFGSVKVGTVSYLVENILINNYTSSSVYDVYYGEYIDNFFPNIALNRSDGGNLRHKKIVPFLHYDDGTVLWDGSIDSISMSSPTDIDVTYKEIDGTNNKIINKKLADSVKIVNYGMLDSSKWYVLVYKVGVLKAISTSQYNVGRLVPVNISNMGSYIIPELLYSRGSYYFQFININENRVSKLSIDGVSYKRLPIVKKGDAADQILGMYDFLELV